MNRQRIYLSLLFAFLSFNLVSKPHDPIKYEEFSSKEGMEIKSGLFTVYTLNNQYYIEIPTVSLDKEILVTTQVVKGFSSFISGASGVYKFTKGLNNTVNLTKNRITDVSADSTDFCMTNAIRKSGLIPVDFVYNITAFGKDGKSPIIEITNDLSSPTGLFNVASFSSLSSPDPSRSGVRSFTVFTDGVVFNVERSQTRYDVNPNLGTGQDVVLTFELQMLIQLLPERTISFQESNKAYGFQTIKRQEYDAKRYIVENREYIQKWHLTASGKDLKKQEKKTAVQPDRQICVYLDPVIPAPFGNSIKKGVMQWAEAFVKAGWKNVFRFSSDPKDALLSYKTIYIHWGNAFSGLNSSFIHNPVTGEILCARINIMDVNADESLVDYFIQCGHSDGRVLKDLHSLELRKDILEAQTASEFSKVLGLKPNYVAYTVYTPENLRSEKWLNSNGISVSVTPKPVFNYLPASEDKVSPENLIPRVSIYDYDAIGFAYGNGGLPRIKESFYSDQDESDPYTQTNALSDDPLKAAVQGIDNLKRLYPELNGLIHALPEEQNTWDRVSKVSMKVLGWYETYLMQITQTVGGRSKHAIIKGVNEDPVTYVSKEKQIEALNYLENEILGKSPEWVHIEELYRSNTYDVHSMMVGLSNKIIGRLIDPKVISSLIAFERQSGNHAFTVKELFAFFDRLIFEDFNPSKPVSPYKRSLQACLISELSRQVYQNNISYDLLNETNGVLHAYFIDTSKKIKKLSETHSDELSRINYMVLVMSMNREYFDK